MAAATVDSKQTGTLSFGTGDTYKELSISSVTTTKSIILISTKIDKDGPQQCFFRAYFFNSSTVRVDRSSSGTAAEVKVQVIEFSAGVTVQHFTGTQSSTSYDETITSVDTSKAFPILTWLNSGAVTGDDDGVTAQITGATTCNLAMTNAQSYTYGLQIVEFDDASVQVKTGSTSTDSQDVTITSVDTSKSFVVMTQRGPSSTNLQAADFYCAYLTSSTNLRLERYTAGDATMTYVAYVVTLSASLGTQDFQKEVTSGNTSGSQTITAVTTAKTVLLAGGFLAQYGSGDDNTDDDYGEMGFTLDLTTTTNVNVARSGSGSDGTAYFYVLEFEVSSDVTFNHTKKAVTATTKTHDLATVFSHTKKAVTASLGTHTWGITVTHTTTAVTASLGTHTIGAVFPHTKLAITATTKTHTPAVTVTHTKTAKTATLGTHTPLIIITFAHTTTAVTATKKTHEPSVVVFHTLTAATATTKTHTLATVFLHTTKQVTAATGTHTPVVWGGSQGVISENENLIVGTIAIII